MEMPRHRALIPLFDVLEGERVVVRPFRESDAEEHFEAVVESREHIQPWLPWARGYDTLDDSRTFIARSEAAWRLRDDLILGIFDRATGRFLGGTGLHPRDWDIPFFEIGYWLRVSAEGHGYMTEAVRLLTDYAFESLGANRVMIRCDERNTRSAAVAERAGYLREARLRNDSFGADGTLRNTLIFALTPVDSRERQVAR